MQTGPVQSSLMIPVFLIVLGAIVNIVGSVFVTLYGPFGVTESESNMKQRGIRAHGCAIVNVQLDS